MAYHPHQPAPDDVRTVLFTGAKGGVGTSTVAALHALALARAGSPTTLTATSDHAVADLAALLGVPAPEGPAIDVNVVTGVPPFDTAAPCTVVVDGGTGPAGEIPHTENYLVTRPCYLALRRAHHADRRPQGIVLVLEPERSLTSADIEEVLGAPVVATIPVEPATARLIDAGLLAQRRPRVSLVWAH